MKFNIGWFKKHPAAAGAAVVAVLLVLYLLVRKSSGSGGGIAGLAAATQQGQLQMAQLDAQTAAQQDQLNAQISASEYQANLAAQEQNNQLVGSLAGTIIPAQLQSQLYEKQIAAAQSIQASLAPSESTLIQEIASGKLQGHEALQQSDLNALELLLSESNPSLAANAGGLNWGAINNPGTTVGGSLAFGPLKVGLFGL